jgi:hypothetical protein
MVAGEYVNGVLVLNLEGLRTAEGVVLLVRNGSEGGRITVPPFPVVAGDRAEGIALKIVTPGLAIVCRR